MLFDLPVWANVAIDLLVGVPLTGLILFMAGALCGAERLDFLRSLLLAAINDAVVALVASVTFRSLAGPEWDDWWRDTRTILTGGGITLAVSLVVLTALLSPLTSVSVPRGLFVWFMQLPLYALFAALIAGGVLFWRGVEQVTRDQWAKDQFITGAWIFAGFLGAILLMVFGVSMLRRFGRAR